MSDYGKILEVLNNKADRDLRNINPNATDVIIEYQEPTSENNYTWYRLYASGWVEQGGYQSSRAGSSGVTIYLPITMANANYAIAATVTGQQSYFVGCLNKTSTSFLWRSFNHNGEGYDREGSWQVSGKADMTNHYVPIPVQEKEEYEHRVIAFQKPTSANGYVWYRKYADGWVEQGGNGGTMNMTINLPVIMADTYYYASVGFVIAGIGAQNVVKYTDRLVTTSDARDSCTYGGWYVCGMSA